MLFKSFCIKINNINWKIGKIVIFQERTTFYFNGSRRQHSFCGCVVRLLDILQVLELVFIGEKITESLWICYQFALVQCSMVFWRLHFTNLSSTALENRYGSSCSCLQNGRLSVSSSTTSHYRGRWFEGITWRLVPFKRPVLNVFLRYKYKCIVLIQPCDINLMIINVCDF